MLRLKQNKSPKDYMTTVPSWWEQAYFIRGESYRVIKEFIDADGDSHVVGEEWLFLGSMHSHYDGLFTLCVRFENNEDQLIELLTRPEAQKDIVDHFSTYIIRKINWFGGII